MNRRRGYKSGEGLTFLHEAGHFFIWSTVLGHLFTQKRALLPWSGCSLSQPGWRQIFGRWLTKGAWSRGSAQGRSKPFPATKWNHPDDEGAGPSYLPRGERPAPKAADLLLQAPCSSPQSSSPGEDLPGVSPDPGKQRLQIPRRAAFVLLWNPRQTMPFESLSSGFHQPIPEAGSGEKGEPGYPDRSQSSLFSQASVTTPQIGSRTVNAGTTILLQMHNQTF